MKNKLQQTDSTEVRKRSQETTTGNYTPTEWGT